MNSGTSRHQFTSRNPRIFPCQPGLANKNTSTNCTYTSLCGTARDKFARATQLSLDGQQFRVESSFQAKPLWRDQLESWTPLCLLNNEQAIWEERNSSFLGYIWKHARAGEMKHGDLVGENEKTSCEIEGQGTLAQVAGWVPPPPPKPRKYAAAQLPTDLWLSLILIPKLQNNLSRPSGLYRGGLGECLFPRTLISHGPFNKLRPERNWDKGNLLHRKPSQVCESLRWRMYANNQAADLRGFRESTMYNLYVILRV